MQITLYNTSSMPNVVHKAKSVIETLEGDLKENVNRENVIVTIPYTSAFASINYAYIPDFNRYYFVSVDVLSGERLRLTMKSDALSSFWSSYCGSQCIAKRSSSNYNSAIRDDMIAFKPEPKIIRRKTSAKFTPSSSGGCYILTIGGK